MICNDSTRIFWNSRHIPAHYFKRWGLEFVEIEHKIDWHAYATFEANTLWRSLKNRQRLDTAATLQLNTNVPDTFAHYRYTATLHYTKIYNVCIVASFRSIGYMIGFLQAVPA